MFLLDTNVVSELRKLASGRLDTNVSAWAAKTYELTLFISVVTILEIEQGILSLARRDKPQASILRNWLERSVLVAFDGRILPIDVPIALRCAGLHVPHQRAERDALIAATALVHAMTVVTRNVVDFAQTGVGVFNPWLADPHP